MNRSLEQLKEEGFSQDQILEIEEGLKSGLSVEVYAQKEFLAMQMRQIRLGLQEGLNVHAYAKTEYDWLQMEEIRKGLSEGLDINLYAFPDISYDKMQQIREGLKDGIDLSLFKKMEAGILKQLRLALKSKINIVPYIMEGYDTEQLEAIRKALEKGLTLTPYLQKDLRGISLEEIFTGLEHDVNVSIYAKNEYCWQQMREIRLGLEHMIDVEQYSSHFYSWQQMKEIRLGLEDGLDVSYFKSPMYTAKEMQERRLFLKDNPSAGQQKSEELPKPDTDTGEHFLIQISPDEMEAYIDVRGYTKEYERADILRALNSHGVCFGIRYEEIDNIIKGNSFRKNLLIAQGTRPEEGKDGWYEFFFRTQVARTPKELEHGNVDYRNIEWFETVEEGQKLAYYHNATPGTDGFSVTGKTIVAKRGREQSILTGKGFKRLADGKTYISSLRGMITIHDFCLEVSKLLVMNDVSLVTGNVDFDGSVYIKGNVSSGTRIRATEDVVVDGFVESSEIICDGNAVLHQGMNAAGNGYIRAGKDVVGYFFEATDIFTGGNIQGDSFLNCNLSAEGMVCVTGKKGMLAGGSVYARKGFKAYVLGNQAEISTFVKLGIGESILQKERNIDSEIQNVNRELYILGNARDDMQRKYPPEIRNTMELFIKIGSAVYTKEKQLEVLLREKRNLEEEKRQTEYVGAVIENQTYNGVTVEINGLRWSSKNLIGSITVKKINNRIVAYSNE